MRLKGMKMLGILLVLSLVICLTSATAFANTSSVQIYLNGNLLTTYTTSQLNGFDDTSVTHNYSSYSCKSDSVVRYDAKGPNLDIVLSNALSGSGYNLSDVNTIEFHASDNYTTGALSRSSVLATRYFYDTSNNEFETPAIIATQYGSYGGTLSSTNCLRDFYGQTDIDEEVINNWVKNLDKIYLVTN